ncbi:MAG: hypothetical protein LAO24_11630 [Acidobacteriia bacterium]|nr:hypothetical protein [Terriglobia bacterium]
MPQPINYDEIISRLVQKTEEGKISWSQVFSSNTFTCTVEGEFTFRIAKWVQQEETFVRLSMTDKENNEIFQVEQDVDYALGRKLSDLHEAARRVALNVEEKINAAKDILGRI